MIFNNQQEATAADMIDELKGAVEETDEKQEVNT